MALDQKLVLFSVQGVMNQLQIARQIMVNDEYPTTALDAVIASVATLHAVVDIPEPVAPADPAAGCTHPLERRQRQELRDGWYELCAVCGALVDQSSNHPAVVDTVNYVVQEPY